MAQPVRMDRRQLLASLDLFAHLVPREAEELLAVTTTRKLDARDTLFRKGDPGDQLFAVVEGRLKAVSSGADGREIVFGLMEPGETIGEISILDSQPRSASVVALEPTVLLCLHRRDLLPFLERNPKVTIRIAGLLAGRLRRLSEHVEDASFLTLASRLAKKLLRLKESFGRSTPEGVRIELRLPQQEIGELVGTSRESINKQLRSWAQQDLVRFEGGYLTILDVRALEAIAKLLVG
jgi:CRP-like cAMP-binding protein